MRLWSLHPSYLDAKGLVALWREALLAKAVLSGQTKGYKHHPQLNRFKETDEPLDRINQYLSEVYFEAQSRGYHFNKDKVDWNFKPAAMLVTRGQLLYEEKHLLGKLNVRDPEKYREVSGKDNMIPHPLFTVIDGGIAAWEIL